MWQATKGAPVRERCHMRPAIKELSRSTQPHRTERMVLRLCEHQVKAAGIVGRVSSVGNLSTKSMRLPLMTPSLWLGGMMVAEEGNVALSRKLLILLSQALQEGTKKVPNTSTSACRLQIAENLRATYPFARPSSIRNSLHISCCNLRPV